MSDRLQETVIAAAVGAATFAVINHFLRNGLGGGGPTVVRRVPATTTPVTTTTDVTGLWDWWQPATSWFAVWVYDPLRNKGWWDQGGAKKLTRDAAQVWTSEATERNWDCSAQLYEQRNGSWQRA